jgi:hypothetical protein
MFQNISYEEMEEEENYKWGSNIGMVVLLIAFQNQGNGHKLNYNEKCFFLFNSSVLTAFFKIFREC